MGIGIFENAVALIGHVLPIGRDAEVGVGGHVGRPVAIRRRETTFQRKDDDDLNHRVIYRRKQDSSEINRGEKRPFNLETAGRRGGSGLPGIDLPADIPCARSVGPRACLQALRTRVLAHSHGALARAHTYSHRALAHTCPCLQARAVLFASRYSYPFDSEQLMPRPGHQTWTFPRFCRKLYSDHRIKGRVQSQSRLIARSSPSWTGWIPGNGEEVRPEIPA